MQDAYKIHAINFIFMFQRWSYLSPKQGNIYEIITEYNISDFYFQGDICCFLYIVKHIQGRQ